MGTSIEMLEGCLVEKRLYLQKPDEHAMHLVQEPGGDDHQR